MAGSVVALAFTRTQYYPQPATVRQWRSYRIPRMPGCGFRADPPAHAAALRGGTVCHPHRSGGGPSTGTPLQPRRSRKSAEVVTTDSRPVSLCRSQEKPWRTHGNQHPDP